MIVNKNNEQKWCGSILQIHVRFSNEDKSNPKSLNIQETTCELSVVNRGGLCQQLQHLGEITSWRSDALMFCVTAQHWCDGKSRQSYTQSGPTEARTDNQFLCDVFPINRTKQSLLLPWGVPSWPAAWRGSSTTGGLKQRGASSTRRLRWDTWGRTFKWDGRG